MLHWKMISIVKCEMAASGEAGLLDAIKDMIYEYIDSHFDGAPKEYED